MEIKIERVENGFLLKSDSSYADENDDEILREDTLVFEIRDKIAVADENLEELKAFRNLIQELEEKLEVMWGKYKSHRLEIKIIEQKEGTEIEEE